MSSFRRVVRCKLLCSHPKSRSAYCIWDISSEGTQFRQRAKPCSTFRAPMKISFLAALWENSKVKIPSPLVKIYVEFIFTKISFLFLFQFGTLLFFDVQCLLII